MTSSKPAYLPPKKEFYYEFEHPRPATMNSLQKSSQPRRGSLQTELDRLVEEIKKKKVVLITQVYPPHRTAVQSIQQTDDQHVLFILFCAYKLLCAGKVVTSASIWTECQNFAQRLPTNFSDVLFEVFPSTEVELGAAATPIGATQDVTNSVTPPVNEAAARPPSAPTTPSRTPADVVDGLTRGGQTSVSASSVVQDEPDNIGFSIRSAAPMEPAVNSPTKSGESLLGATAAASPDVASFRIPEQREGGHRKGGGDLQADGVRQMKECLWAVQHENKILETYKQCVQCKKNPRDITFLPCGHFITCRQCAGPIFTCMLCNRAILATIDTYLS